MSEQERNRKQVYLRTAIMDAGYDVEQFITILSSRKEDGSNIDNWTFDELKEVVEEFKVQVDRKRSMEAEPDGTKPSAAKIIPPTKDFNNEALIYRERFPYTVKTQAKDVNELTNAPVKAKIVEAKVVDKGLFSSGHVSYKIEVPSKGWSVERRFKDFGDLRVELERLHPGYLVPPIYGPVNEKETKPGIISNTKQVLQQFLDDLLKHPLFGCSELVYSFLQSSAQTGKKVDEFQKKLKLYSIAQVPREVEEMKTENGVAVIGLGEEVTAHIEVMNDSVGKLKQLYKEYPYSLNENYRVQKLNKEMAGQIDKLSETMTKQVGVYKEMSFHYKLLKQSKMGSAYDTLQTIFGKLNTSYLQVQRMISEIFKPLNKQFYYELQIVENKLNEVKSVHTQMVTGEKKLIERKMLLFEQQQISKWDLAQDCAVPMDELFTNNVVALREILPKESKECSKIRLLHGYLCNKLTEEFKRVCEKDKDQVSFGILFTSKMCRDTAKEVHNMWAELTERYAGYAAVLA